MDNVSRFDHVVAPTTAENEYYPAVAEHGGGGLAGPAPYVYIYILLHLLQ